MNFDEALKLVDAGVFARKKRHLKDVEVIILKGAWQGQRYEDIAEAEGYTAKYLRQDIGPKLWKLLSEVLGENVSKTNFQTALERQWQRSYSTGYKAATLTHLEAVPQTQATIASDSGLEAEVTTFMIPDFVRVEAAMPAAGDVNALPHEDWGEAIDVSVFFGRTKELDTLKQWMVEDRCRLVTLLGMGGIGKTALAAKLAEQIQGQFEYLIWRSLRPGSPLLATLADLNEFLSQKSQTEIPATVDGQISCLLTCLRAHRCLVILDDWEMVLRGGDIAGYYREGYEGYGQLIRRVGEERHQSCLLLLSREKPIEVASLAGETLPVRALQLKGLKPADAKKLLATKGFEGTENGLDELIGLYGGNPSALKMVAATIQELFNGNIAQFLGESSIVIGDIFSNLLNQHFERVSDLGKAIMYWLAIERQPVSLSRLKTNLRGAVPSSELLAVLESLGRRSLIDKEQKSPDSTQLFTLQPVVMKYVTNQFIEQASKDISEAIKAQQIEKLGLLRTHTLVKEQEPEYIKSIPESLILTRIQERLCLSFGNANCMEVRLRDLLSRLRGYPSQVIGYAEDNLLKLLAKTEKSGEHLSWANEAGTRIPETGT